jgi:hypothetical protein
LTTWTDEQGISDPRLDGLLVPAADDEAIDDRVDGRAGHRLVIAAAPRSG